MTSMRSDLQRIAHRAMLDRGLVPEFSAAEMAEARGLDPVVGPADPQIRDLRGLLWASIDNDDSLDLDQLTVAEAISPTATRILVAIADVDAKVKQGSALDHHARTNTTSVYTDAQIFPMLPEVLSTDLTSLNEGHERLALVVDMVVDADGQVTAGELSRAVVVNRAKLAYNAVAAWFEGKSEPPAAGPLASRGWPTTCACKIASHRRCGSVVTSAARWIWRRWSRARCSRETPSRICGSNNKTAPSS